MPLKSREYEERVKTMGLERATRWAIMELIERQNQLEKQLFEVAQGMDQITNIVSNFVTVAENMKNMSEKLDKRLRGVPDDAPVPADDRLN